VTRKGPKSNHVKQRNAIRDADVKKVWDTKDSLEANYAKLGLCGSANDKVKDIRFANSKERGYEGLIKVGQVAGMPGQFNPDHNPRSKKLSEEEQIYIVRLIKKYGNDYKAMERDIKTNVKQFSESQAKKACVKYLSLPLEDRLSHLPPTNPASTTTSETEPTSTRKAKINSVSKSKACK